MKKCTATKTEELAIKFLSKYMEYNSFWETDSHQAGQETAYILWPVLFKKTGWIPSFI